MQRLFFLDEELSDFLCFLTFVGHWVSAQPTDLGSRGHYLKNIKKSLSKQDLIPRQFFFTNQCEEKYYESEVGRGAEVL
jgi:hypothetical protein